MSAAPVFDLNMLTRTEGVTDVSESHVLSLTTPHTMGPIESDFFLQFGGSGAEDALLATHTLQPGAEQVLIRSDAQSSYTYGNLSVFINPAVSAGSTAQPVAYSLTVGKDRQTLIQGVNLATGTNQTAWKEEYWDVQTTLNEDQVKVSYFVVNSTTQNSTASRFTFETETLIQWGDRYITRYGDTTNVTVAKSVSLTSEGDSTSVNIGDIQIKNYAGVNIEAVNGGSNIAIAAGAKMTYAEGIQCNGNLGAGFDLHLYYGSFQGMGMGSSILKYTAVSAAYKTVIGQIKAFPARVGSGAIDILTGFLTGTPRV